MYCDCMQWFIFHATRLLFALTFDLFFLPLLHILCLLQFLLHLSLLLFNKSLHFFSPILPIPHPCFFPSPQYFSLTSFLHSILDYLLSTCSSLLCSLLHVCWFYFLHPFLSVRSISLCEWMPESKEMNGPAFISRCVSSYTDMTPLVLHCP